MIRQIPNFFTLLNLAFGVIAIIFILQPGLTIAYVDRTQFTEVNLVDLPEKLTWGALFIFGAAIIDFLDGFVARMFRASSEMGKQLDSLADVVSFGVAPGLIIYQFLRMSYAQQENGLDVSIIWLLPSLLIPCAAAWRLARFNISSDQQYSFTGLPTPAAGLVVASIPLIYWFQILGIQHYFINKWVLYLLVILISYLMVSGIRLLGMKFRDYSFSNNVPRYLLLIISLIAIIFLQWLAAPLILLVYVLLSLIFKNQLA